MLPCSYLLYYSSKKRCWRLKPGEYYKGGAQRSGRTESGETIPFDESKNPELNVKPKELLSNGGAIIPMPLVKSLTLFIRQAD